MSKKIKSLRILYGFTQEDIAKQMGISRVTYRLKENGTLKFNIDELRILAKLLKMNASEIEDIFFTI